MDPLTATKKPYQAPKLQAWGSVVELTQVGNSQLIDDCFGGSVYARGLEAKCAR